MTKTLIWVWLVAFVTVNLVAGQNYSNISKIVDMQPWKTPCKFSTPLQEIWKQFLKALNLFCTSDFAYLRALLNLQSQNASIVQIDIFGIISYGMHQVKISEIISKSAWHYICMGPEIKISSKASSKNNQWSPKYKIILIWASAKQQVLINDFLNSPDILIYVFSTANDQN